MNLKQYMPSETPLVFALRIGPRVLFLGGCLLAILTLLSKPGNGLQFGRLGTGAFSLGFAVVAGKGLANEQYFRTVFSLVLAVAVGTVVVGSSAVIDPAIVTQILTIFYFFWLVIGSMTKTGINQDEDPVLEGADTGEVTMSTGEG